MMVARQQTVKADGRPINFRSGPLPAPGSVLEWDRTGYQRRSDGRGGTALSKVRFLSVVRAKLRTKVMAGRRPPKFKLTIAGAEWLATEHAADGAFKRYLLLVSMGISPPSEITNTVLQFELCAAIR